MQVIKKLNNNAAICIDNNGRQLVAIGNGIGFPKTPYTLNDMSKIRKTFYGINTKYFGLLNEIEDEIFILASLIVDQAKNKLKYSLNPNMVFTLADHIKFAKDRYQKKLCVPTPYSFDFCQQFEQEMEIAQWAIKMINKKLQINLVSQEAVGIAMHFVNGQFVNNDDNIDEINIINQITKIIENQLGIIINKKGFNYARFATHMQYLLRRSQTKTLIASANHSIFSTISQKYPQIFECVMEINDYFIKNIGWNLVEEEQLYLILHINRVCSRENC